MKKYKFNLKEGEALICDHCEEKHEGPIKLWIIIAEKSAIVNCVTCEREIFGVE